MRFFQRIKGVADDSAGANVSLKNHQAVAHTSRVIWRSYDDCCPVIVRNRYRGNEDILGIDRKIVGHNYSRGSVVSFATRSSGVQASCRLMITPRLRL